MSTILKQSKVHFINERKQRELKKNNLNFLKSTFGVYNLTGKSERRKLLNVAKFILFGQIRISATVKLMVLFQALFRLRTFFSKLQTFKTFLDIYTYISQIFVRGDPSSIQRPGFFSDAII